MEAGQGWKRSKCKDANGRKHDGQSIQELKGGTADLRQARAPRRLHALPVITKSIKSIKKRSDAASDRRAAPRAVKWKRA